MMLSIPELSLVVLVGPSGSGKSTFARKHFKATEVLSSDYCRGLVCDDENSLAATEDAFAVLHFIAGRRLAGGRLTVIDATNVQAESRRPLVALAREFHCLPVAIVFDLPERICQQRNALRSDRDGMAGHVIRNQRGQLRRSLRDLKREGFAHVFVFKTPDEVEAASIERAPLWNNLKHERGPFDIIGDIHGCFDELRELLDRLGYEVASSASDHRRAVTHPAGRRLIFLGDLVDRGPRVVDVLGLVMGAVESGLAVCVPGNHDVKLLRKLRGKNAQITHGLAETLAQLEGEADEFKQRVAEFIDSLVSHYVLDDGNLVVAHAGLKEPMQGRGSAKVRDFCLYGETTGETDEFGLPVRYPWAEDYRGRAMVVYGHTPVPEAEWLNRTINIDTGCVFGGRLTALRYPERELVSVAAARVYAQPSKPFPVAAAPADALTAQQQHDDMLDFADVSGKRFISTRLMGNVTIREGHAAAALEVMSRFAVNPKWLIYLPPTMSPSETSREPGLLEHPAEALDYFLHQGVSRVVCEEKHMGSRAVVALCRDESAARQRFGVSGEGMGVVYTRTGRRFFHEDQVEMALLDRLNAAFDRAGLWSELDTDWVLLDCELMPWSMKAQDLLRHQYAAVAAAGRAALPAAIEAVQEAAHRESPALVDRQAGIDAAPVAGTPPAPLPPTATALLERYEARAAMLEDYARSYRRYCWPVRAVDDLKLAPFHLLGSRGCVHVGRDHVWHMEMLARACREDEGVLLATPFRVVDVTDAESRAAAIAWWQELTGRGGEGMVVKPLDFVTKGARGTVQPALKCRGREYLRIIYGPEYTASENLERLRARGLRLKRLLALREFALGIEAMERFVRGEPLRRVHECVFGVLAMESEPVDPRL